MPRSHITSVQSRAKRMRLASSLYGPVMFKPKVGRRDERRGEIEITILTVKGYLGGEQERNQKCAVR